MHGLKKSNSFTIYLRGGGNLMHHSGSVSSILK